MRRDRLLLGSALLLIGACTRVPADVSAPQPEVEAATAELDSGTPAKPATSLPEGCVTAELTTCIKSCDDFECLEWCGGQACAVAVESISACVDEAVAQAERAGPAPQIDYETLTDPEGEYQVPTDESLERQMQWEDARRQLMDERWSDSCHAGCIEQLGSEDERAHGFCRDWRTHQSALKRVSRPVKTQNVDTAALGVTGVLSADSGSFAMFGVTPFGTSVRLAGELGDQPRDIYSSALAQIIAHAGGRLRDTEACVSTLSEDGQTFVVDLEFGPLGEVVAATDRDGSAEGECVAQSVAKAMEVPARVAHTFPHVEIAVDVRPPLDLGWGENGLDYGEAEGFGSAGWGEGGGGGESIGGIGTVGRGGGGSIGGLGSGGAAKDDDDDADAD